MANRQDYLKFYPEAEFAPWDPPPIGTRVQRESDSGVHFGRVVGASLNETQTGRVHLNCSTCSCQISNPYFGWWEIESERYKDSSTGRPEVMLEYPPAWKRAKGQ